MPNGELSGLMLKDPIFLGFVAMLGAIVGSFLNVVIHRLPRGLSVHDPKRSFCPACNAVIPWYQNIPILSWILLRGRCAKCQAPIPVRYVLVEALTASLFLGLWWTAGENPLLAIGLLVFCAIAIAATFIDLEHMIIPDSLTLGGAVAGLIFSIVAPQLQGTPDRMEAAGWSIIGALAGVAILWGVVEAGKLAFGRVRITAENVDDPPSFSLEPAPQQPLALVLDNQVHVLEETFSRESDRIRIHALEAMLNGKKVAPGRIDIAWDHLESPAGNFKLDQVEKLNGTFSEVVLPREAMGLGDVKFMAAIGAFFGWQAVVFSLVVGSVIGAIVGVAILAARRRAGSMGSGAIPFGPYLALGALLWAFAGPTLVDSYLGLLREPAGF